MAEAKIESFILKFKTMSSAGVKGSLQNETIDGKVSVSLSPSLGRLSHINIGKLVEKYRGQS